jgi:hypothetical protein
MHEDSPNTRTAMVLIFMGLVIALAAVLFVMIAYGYGETSGPGGFPSAQVEGRNYQSARSSIDGITNAGLQKSLVP